MNLFCDQTSPSEDLVRREVSSTNMTGGDGLVNIIAPFPTSETPEFPNRLVAMTLACTLEPHSRLNGKARKTETGIVHEVASLTRFSIP